MNKKVLIGTLILVIIIISILGTIWTRKFFAIDSCLDSGGSWNYELKKCEKYYDFNSVIIADFYWHTEFDTTRNYEFLEKGKLLDSISQTPNVLIEILNRRTAKSKLEYIDQSSDTIRIRIIEDEFLGEQMGSTGAFCFLGETVFTLTENNSINYVNIEMNYGSHASPGIYSRNDFKELLKK
jgi:hypothetical protein